MRHSLANIRSNVGYSCEVIPLLRSLVRDEVSRVEGQRGRSRERTNVTRDGGTRACQRHE